MIIFKNNAADVQWSLEMNAIICHWKDNTNFEELKEVILAVTELQEVNQLDYYISDRSSLDYLWSGYLEWYSFKLFQVQLSDYFKKIMVLDPNNSFNKNLLSNHEQISTAYSHQKIKHFTKATQLNNYIHKISIESM
ncbi:hypothetical protein [Flammeovirga pacifica]|uniref:Uncharacterized protein n=1 Tax=Flammeovirga pacifica TaxID=915059 RepID=A0A1S1YVE9_FLAPC|nr:hypothetical protein [Flammeovirga pacifica]OHX65008.1 hypothetical protein NH26_00900 [Flammeovirga pacifica]